MPVPGYKLWKSFDYAGDASTEVGGWKNENDKEMIEIEWGGYYIKFGGMNSLLSYWIDVRYETS